MDDLDIVLIVIDTLGAEQVGFYHGDPTATPALDRLARDGVVFRNAFSSAPWTQPAVASIFTGRMPSRHGVQNIRDVLGEEEQTLAELLRGRGYGTSGVVSHELLRGELGFAQGFERYDESAIGGHQAIVGEAVTDLGIAELRRTAAARATEGANQNFFLFLHYFDPHFYYHAHAAFDRTSEYDGPLRDVEDVWAIREARPELREEDVAFLVGRHREEIAYTDQQIGRFLAELDRLELDENTLVIVVGDHGEEFMGHGWIGHTRTLYNELTRVPMIVSLPGRFPHHVVEEPVSTMDLLPTLSAGMAEPPALTRQDGQSLFAALANVDAHELRLRAPRDVLSEVAFLPPGSQQIEKLAYRTSAVRGTHKAIHDRLTDGWEFFDLSRDPDEQTPLDADAFPVFRELARAILAWEEAAPPPDSRETELELDADQLERLRSLGYVR